MVALEEGKRMSTGCDEPSVNWYKTNAEAHLLLLAQDALTQEAAGSGSLELLK